MGQQSAGQQLGLAGGATGGMDVGETRSQMALVSSDAATLFGPVSDAQFPMALSTGLTLFGLPPLLQGQVAGGALLATQIAQAVSNSGSSVAMMLSAGASTGDPLSRVVVVLQELVTT